MMKYLLVFWILLAGCAQLSLFQDKQDKFEEMDPEVAAKQKAADEPEIINAEKVLALGRFEEARILFKDFQTRRPDSVFYQSSRLGEAQCLEGMGQPQDAVNLYRDVSLKTERYQPEISALALYRMSFAYEELGDDVKVVAVLLDAKKRGANLPVEVREAQIPARLAAAYARANRETEAMQYLAEADKGISRVMREKGKDLKKDWLTKTYYEMGSVSTNQLSLGNFEDFIRGQKTVQVFLLKALKLDDPIWSERSLQRLRTTYQSLFIQFESAGKNHAQQIRMGGAFVDLMDQADLFRPLAGQPGNTHETDFYSYVSEVRKKTENILYGTEGFLTLTEESQRLNSLKRPGRVKAESLLPEEQKSIIPLPPKVVPSEDPNL